MNNLFVRKVEMNSMSHNMNKYPFDIECLRNFQSLTFEKKVSFFIGENGIGKSTFIEALAVALGLNAEGGTQNFNFYTKQTHSDLYKYFKVIKGVRKPQTKFFLRAESFYNVASYMDEMAKDDVWTYYSYGHTSLHECSHGESFMQVMTNRFSPNGLYILDEPEAALSPMRQLSLLVLIHDLSLAGSQFIISTHSPILLSYRDGVIYDLDHHFEKVDFKETNIYQTYQLVLDNPEGMRHHLFDEK